MGNFCRQLLPPFHDTFHVLLYLGVLYSPIPLFVNITITEIKIIEIHFQFFMENGIPYDPEYVFHDVRVCVLVLNASL